jgi:hypothetical protein
MAAQHKVVTAFVYDTVSGGGSGSVYGVTGFARFELTQSGMNGASGSDYLKFLGWADADGNQLPPGFTPF